jgi:D-alanyl-D-alanine carboxypeptidase
VTPERHYVKYILIAMAALAIIGALGYLGYENYTLKKEKAAMEADFAVKSEMLLNTIDDLKVILGAAQTEKSNLEQDLNNERALVDSIEAQVNSISGTVGTLKKLNETDHELLAKYSKVYFLNENYFPKNLMPILSQYVYAPENQKLILGEVWPFLQKMMDDAQSAGIDLKIISAYRSFAEQAGLKSAYTVTYGSGANKFSADQGYSEHQLGTTIDFTTAKLSANFSSFEKTDGYRWLTENAYKYGFILSYPKGNSYYIYEPWHWRFVGKALALDLHNQNKHFYDLTQREIDQYLVSLFDQ